MATEVNAHPAMPQLQSLQKAMALPSVGAAVGQVGALYSKVKGAHSLLEWALSTAEASVTLAATTAAPYVSAPLANADARVAAAIDELERRVPLVAEQPKVIVETTKQAVLARVSPHVNKVAPQMFQARVVAEQRVKSLKDLSWAKANALLSTAYGQKALTSVDSGACYAMKLLDHYLPALNEEKVSNEVVPASSDPALHAVQTVGSLSAVAARRVWANLAYKITELRRNGIELDFRRYITALMAALQLADVTRQQQKQEEEKQKQQQQPASPPPAPAPAPAPQQTDNAAPPTAKKVKSTPEGKSKKDANNSHNKSQ